jgi:hypothetical protein
MSLEAIVRMYTHKHRLNAQAELNWFRQQPFLNAAIECAALAKNCKGKRCSHQRRIPKTCLEKAKHLLLSNSEAVAQAEDFDALFNLIEKMCKPIKGLGELYIYDTSLRIGAKRDLMPTKVYLHAGTRRGAKTLGFNGGVKAIDVSDMPKQLQQLEPREIEDVLCIFKDLLQKSLSKKIAVIIEVYAEQDQQKAMEAIMKVG